MEVYGPTENFPDSGERIRQEIAGAATGYLLGETNVFPTANDLAAMAADMSLVLTVLYDSRLPEVGVQPFTSKLRELVVSIDDTRRAGTETAPDLASAARFILKSVKARS